MVALLFGLLLATGAANAAFVVPPVPTPPVPTAPEAAPGTPGGPDTPAPPSGQAPNDTLPAPSSPEAPSSGPGVAQRVPAEALQAVPFSTQPPVPNAVTCYIVVDKVTPTKPVSNIVGRGCHNGPRIPPLLNGLLPGGQGATSPPAPNTAPSTAPDSSSDPSTSPAPAPRFRNESSGVSPAPAAALDAPAAMQQASSVPLAEFYGGANYGGSSFIIYGSGGGCDSLGYRLPDLAGQNSSVGGASSYRTYNNCSNQAIHNQTDFGGAANYYTGYNRSSLPSGYDNSVRSARLASVPCTYYNETNASVCGVIRDKYNALGGPDGPLGFPTSNELTNPDGVGKRNTFQGATSIYWTPATGAHDVRGALRDAWARNGWETGVLGYPLSDQIAIATGDGRTNRFFKNNTYAAGTTTRNTGAIYWSPATNARALVGDIWDKYSALGGATSNLGYPTSDEVNTSDNAGKQNSFYKGNSYTAGTAVPSNGNIIWSSGTGARAVNGLIRARYFQYNDVRSCLGYPISDVRAVANGEIVDFGGRGDRSAPWESPESVSVNSQSGQAEPTCQVDIPPNSNRSIVLPLVNLDHAISMRDAATLTGRGVVGAAFSQSGLTGEFYFDSAKSPEQNAAEAAGFVQQMNTVPVAVRLLTATGTSQSARDAIRRDSALFPVANPGPAEAESPPPQKFGSDSSRQSAQSVQPTQQPPQTTMPRPIYAPNFVQGSARENQPGQVTIENTYVWDRAQNSNPTTFPQDWGFELEFNMNNPANGPFSRPACGPGTDAAFYAARVFTPTNVRGWYLFGAGTDQIDAYFDTNDESDPCRRQSFAIGIGTPQAVPETSPGQTRLQTGVITDRGTEPNSVIDTTVDAVSNDCNDVNLRPQTDCMGLNFDRVFPPGFGKDNFPTLNVDRGFRVPGGYSYRHPDLNPVYIP